MRCSCPSNGGLPRDFYPLSPIGRGGTPSAIVGRLNAETVKVLNRTDVKATLAAQGLEVNPGSPEQFAAYIKSEIARVTRIGKAAGIKAE